MMAFRFPPGGIQAVHARQNEQRVSLHQTRDVHGKNIVIPKFQLFHGYGVVLIHNRDDAAVLKQAQHRSLHIATAAFQILRRQQKLGHIHVKVVEKILICLHQPRLPYGGARLFQGQLLRIGRKTQDGHAGPYSAGADQNHLMPLLHQPRQALTKCTIEEPSNVPFSRVNTPVPTLITIFMYFRYL